MTDFPHQAHFDFYPHTLRRTKHPMNNALGSFDTQSLVAPFKFSETPYEYKVVPLRECTLPTQLHLCDTPEAAVSYWQENITKNPYYNPECECLAAIMVNTRRRVKGHYLISIGTQDSVLAGPREVFRLAVLTAANAIILAHNHTSGDATPSAADLKVTRDLIKAGQLLKIELLDHIIVGNPGHSSLREQGYFY